MKNGGGEYRTQELSLASALNLNGHAHQRLELRHGRTAVWVFQANDDVCEIVDLFYKGAIEVEPRRFALTMANVRSEMYAFVRNERERAADRA
jgi:hypothetical protein